MTEIGFDSEDGDVIYRRLYPSRERKAAAPPTAEPEPRLSIGRRAADLVILRNLPPPADLYTTQSVIARPQERLEVNESLLELLESATGWASNNTPQDLAKNVQPEDFAGLLDDPSGEKRPSTEDLAARIVNAVKAKVVVDHLFGADGPTSLQIAEDYHPHPKMLERAILYAQAFIDSRDGFKARLQNGLNSPHQLLITRPPRS